ncbi:MAG TPA: tRNA uridine-5-carboxymethylaminomethyl(34) synthesis GTPase MnmE [Gammaproteobacteria bacterium]|nr:tRNA uridine-5-carboxymethylaminomethyl(34) synthesis GTPase MnmE [Gammaproteobacteria bacterium]
MREQRDDTIAALATAPGAGAVAIVRLSGPKARAIGEALTGVEARARYAELCTFRGVGGEALDRGLVLFFPGPCSYTGEDVVELHGHGGLVVTDALLARAYSLGARPAQPGEFTLRAFLNDKLDLLQAEAVADLVASGSVAAARAALRSLDGQFSAQVAALQAALTHLRVKIEAWLDFPDEEIRFDAADECATAIDALLADLASLARAASSGAVLRDGLSVAIAGPPNAGKSSLLNRLAGYDAAIVTDIPGTTRDPLREHLTLDGLPITIVDTAGLRESADPVEQEGLRRARLEAGRADRVLWVVDVREPLEAARAAARANLGDAPFTLVRNKIDLAPDEVRQALADRPAGSRLSGATAETGGAHSSGAEGAPVLAISALTGAGIDALIAHLHSVAGYNAAAPGTFSARRRHLAALERARTRLVAARRELDGALELAAEELRGAQAALAELTGELTSDDLLGEIFATFCIGK